MINSTSLRTVPRSLLASLLLCLTALLLAACAGGGDAKRSIASGTARAVSSTPVLGPPDTTNNQGQYTGVSDYYIGPLDLLEISVFQIDDLSRKVRVNTTGFISLPLIGAVRAGGMTVNELEAEIASKYAEKYLQDPQVSVFVSEFTSQRITIEGSISKPGIFPLTGRTSLLQAVAMAGGLDDMADPEGIIIFRVIDGQKMAALFNLKEIRAGNIEDPQLYGDDIVVVDRSGAKSAFKTFRESLRDFAIFRVF